MALAEGPGPCREHAITSLLHRLCHTACHTAPGRLVLLCRTDTREREDDEAETQPRLSAVATALSGQERAVLTLLVVINPWNRTQVGFRAVHAVVEENAA